ncbi:MAG TPA: SpoIID/LytB domain-containing protein [Vicinamibacteria bacterium]|nr:SpoIID/LytB domain-containing protein [Vicinamibacteria bacterium]
MFGIGEAARRARAARALPKRPSAAAALSAAIAATMALAASCRTVPTPRIGDAGRRPAAGSAASSTTGGPLPVEAYVPGPIVRVGIIVDGARSVLSAESGLIVREAGPLAREVPLPRATFVAVAPIAAGSRFRVQVGSLSDQRGAEELAARVREMAKTDALSRWSEETRTWQVRAGDARTRDEAVALSSRLQQLGVSGGGIAEEPREPTPGRLRLVETGDEFSAASVVPSRSEETLSADGLTYRGVLEVRPGEAGLTVVNVVNLEDYLKGVVPNELSPDAFPQLEALKAQAVAARTYVLRNRGGYAAHGYDICATPSCQVYRGKSTEKALSTQAVDDTRGMIASYQGALINALYTSTCGGHTETGANIFEGEDVPYLVGVSCAPEREAWATIHTTAAPRALGDQPDLNREAALLVSLDVLPGKMYASTALKPAPTEEELRDWVGRLVLSLKRKPCASTVEGALTRRGTFVRHLVSAMCWDDRAQRLLSPDDPEYLLSVEDRAELTDRHDVLAAALLMQEGILTPFPDNTLRTNAPITRAQAIEMLGRTAVAAAPPGLVSAEFRGMSGGGLTVRTDKGEASLPIDLAARLFRSLDGARLGTSELDLAEGDKVTFVAQGGRITFLEAQQSLLGASADRSSKYYRWEVRMTPDEVSKAISRYGTVGQVRDVVPKRFGVSGRVIEAAIVGSDGDLVLDGLRVRWGLGLRENLFVIDRERDAAGNVTRFVFTGKGWGHGVGLCQVGSFGMAQAGSTFDRILQHYYTGIRLRKEY